MIAALAAAAICLSPPELFADADDSYRAVTHPTFPAGVVAAAALVPAGWKVEKRLEGDVDGDRRADLVLLLRGADKGCLAREPDIYDKPLDTNPRALVVALAADGGYRVAASNDRLIPRHLAPPAEDPLENGGVTLSNGALKVGVHHWTSMGSWGVSHRDFTFRWREGRLSLVGYDAMEMKRNTGEVEAASYNYLSRRAKFSTGSIETDRKTDRWTNLPNRPLRAFTAMRDAWAFEP